MTPWYFIQMLLFPLQTYAGLFNMDKEMTPASATCCLQSVPLNSDRKLETLNANNKEAMVASYTLLAQGLELNVDIHYQTSEHFTSGDNCKTLASA